jgi:DUF1365 family protein
MTASSLYVGRIRHRRLDEPVRQFSYPIWHALIDLDELPALARNLRVFSHNRFNLTGFDDRDHMGPEAAPVRGKLAAWLGTQGVETEIGRVHLLTHLRILGNVFNPVSFYFIRDREDRLRHAVAEVNNTFGETFCYLLGVEGSSIRHEEAKRFHVSPFQPLDGRYRFRITEPGSKLTVHIDVLRGGGRVFDTTLSSQRRDFHSSSLLKTVARHPHLGLWTLTLIHAQALRLWLRKAPFFTKPAPPEDAWRTRHGHV